LTNKQAKREAAALNRGKLYGATAAVINLVEHIKLELSSGRSKEDILDNILSFEPEARETLAQLEKSTELVSRQN
jgi:hypothetical protein